MRRTIFIVSLMITAVARGQQIELAIQKGHSSDVVAIDFSSDGTLLASAGKDHLLKLWHVPTGKEMASYVGTTSSIATAIGIVGQNDFLKVEYADGSVHTWDIATSSFMSGSPEVSRKRDYNTFYSKDSTFHITIDRYLLRKVDTRSGSISFKKVPLDISKHFRCVAISEKNNLLLAGAEDGKVYVWDLVTGKDKAILDGHYAAVNCLAFSDDEAHFASGSEDRSIMIRDSETLTEQKRLYGYSFRYEKVVFNHSGTQLAAGDELGSVKLINLLSSRVKISSNQWHDDKISALAFSQNDSVLHSAGFDNTFKSHYVATEELAADAHYKRSLSLGDAFLKKLKAYREPYAWINAIHESPGGQSMVYGGGWRESDIRGQAQKIIFQNEQGHKQEKLLAHARQINDLLFLNNLSFLSAGPDGVLQWTFDPSQDKFFFRKKPSLQGRNIKRLIRGNGDSLILQAPKTILLYDLNKEMILDSIASAEEISAMSFDLKSGRVAFAIFKKLIIQSLRDRTAPVISNSEAHTDKITDIAFNPTRSMLATCSWDATVKLWEPQSGKLICTIVSMGKLDHLIITPDNYYYGTRNSLRGAGFKFGKQFVSPEQFDLRFNRPDIVLQRIGFVGPEVVRSFNRAYHKRLQKLNFTEEMLGEEIHLPEVKVNGSIALKTSEDVVNFRVTATDSKYNLDRINIFVNNVALYGIGGADFRNAKSNSITHDVSARLTAGKNKIQVSCLNDKGVASLLHTFEIVYEPRSPVEPRLFLAVISVSSYQQRDMNLKYARKDGEDLIRTFRNAKAFANIFVDSLFDGRATRKNILALRDKFMKTTVDDQVIVFISGHGLLDENLDFYFATHDIDFKNPAHGGLKYEELEGVLDGIPARKKLLLMDACHSGEVDKSRLKRSESSQVLAKNTKGAITEYSYPADIQKEHYQVNITTSFELMQELFANLSKGSGTVVISAAAGNSYALESDEWRNGVFTYALLNSLKTRSADKNRNKHITVSELKEFVSKEVERLTQGAQRPTSRNENLEFDFRIW